MDKYEAVELKVIIFDAEDVIVTSPVDPTGTTESGVIYLPFVPT